MRGWGVTIAILSWSSVAVAAEPLAAEAAFNRGVEAMARGDFEGACPEIAESQRLEPRAGTLFTLAECWARAGRIATALARYQEYLRVHSRMTAAEKATQRGREEVAQKQVVELGDRVPHLTLKRGASWAHGTTVTLNGVVLGDPSIDLAVPLDPGRHLVVVATAAGARREWVVDLAAGDHEVLPIAPPHSAPPIKEAAVATPRREVLPAVTDLTPNQVPMGLRPTAIAAWSFGAAAMTSLAAGAITGIVVLRRAPRIEQECDVGGDPTLCSAEGARYVEDTQTIADVSTALFIVAGITGTAAIALGAIDASLPGNVSLGPSGLSYRGHF